MKYPAHLFACLFSVLAPQPHILGALISSIPMQGSALSHVEELLEEFKDALSGEVASTENVDARYMRLTELRFLLKNLRELTSIQLYQSYSRPETRTNDETTGGSTVAFVDRKRLHSQIAALDKHLADVRARALLGFLHDDAAVIPRIVRLCRIYEFTEAEADLFHLIVVVQGSQCGHVLNALIEEDYLRRITGFQRVCGLSEVDIEVFCDAERQHIKEGVLLVEEENGAHFNLRCPRTAVQLLFGRAVKTDDLLKISQTALEDILSLELSGRGKVGQEDTGRTRKKATGKRKLEETPAKSEQQLGLGELLQVCLVRL